MASHVVARSTGKQEPLPSSLSDSHRAPDTSKMMKSKATIKRWSSLPTLSSKLIKHGMNTKSYVVQSPHNTEDTTMETEAEVEVSSVEANLVNGDEDLHKNLFLDEDEAWAGSLRRIPATNPTPVPTTTKLNDITSTQDTAYHGPLQHPRRWNPSGGPSSEFHSPMGTNDQSSMAIVCYQRRLPDPVEFAPYSLEISAVNSFSGRSNGSGLSCGKIFAFRDNRTITEPEQPIPVQFLHHPGANETAANPRLPEDKPTSRTHMS
ncbi:hypothetical protein G6F24_014382 [Rhizopus arrhizus]|nr:hypothetical protein G6F24_014382 [Rhizopus arrhizus]